MIRGNATANGHGTPTVTNNAPPLVINNNRSRVENNRPPSMQRANDTDEMARRPIIKEEDLNRMDDMTKDMGWAAQDEIDYKYVECFTLLNCIILIFLTSIYFYFSQKLEFNDDDAAPDRNKNVGKPIQREPDNRDKQDKTESYQDDSKNWNRSSGGGSGPSPGFNRCRNTDEDELLALKRRQQHQVVTTAAERAKQRKEEEEKKYLEAKLKSKREKDQDDGQGTISPSVIPPQPITPTPIPVPDWEKEKDGGKSEPATEESNRGGSNNNKGPTVSDFRQLTQIEAKNVIRKDSNNRNNADRGNSGGYSRQMQNLPPRFQRKQHLRNNSSPQPSYPQYDTRWMNPGQNKTSPTSTTHKTRGDWEENKEDSRYSNEDTRRGRSYNETGRKSSDARYSDDSRDERSQDYDYKKEKEDKWEKKHGSEKEDIYSNHVVINRQSSDEWHSDRHDKYERPQRPDSRDSRASRDSRHSRESMRDSEPREHLGSWAESIAYEERKKDGKEDRRVVPGPITKEKIEADEKQNEKRNLTQLKKGAIPPKHDNPNEKSQEKDSWSHQGGNDVSKPWADDVSTSAAQQSQEQNDHQVDSKETKKSAENLSEVKEGVDVKKSDLPEKDDKKSYPPSNRHRQENTRSQGWDRGSAYRSWYKKPKSSRSTKVPGSKNDWQCTDSDASIDEMSVGANDGVKDDKGLRSSQKSPRPHTKKLEKDDKNREMVMRSSSDKSESSNKVDSKMDKVDKPVTERKMDKYSEPSKRETYEPRGKCHFFCYNV